MLNTPPPGYNTNDINAQSVARLSTPGQQGITAQGYYDPYKSSFSTPSSYAVPSTVDTPQPWYGQQGQQGGQPGGNIAAMLQALRGSQ